MKFDSNGTTFTCHCEDREFDPYVVVAAVEWCANHSEGWNYAINSATEYTIKDFGEGLEPVGEKHWSVRIWFTAYEDAIAFRLVIDALVAEAAC
jgi:hypothetical protein